MSRAEAKVPLASPIFKSTSAVVRECARDSGAFYVFISAPDGMMEWDADEVLASGLPLPRSIQ